MQTNQLLTCIFIGPKLPHPMALHSMVAPQDRIITVGGTDGTSSMSDLFQMTCEPDNCIWTKMSQELRIPRHGAVAILVPDEVLQCNQV